jgi:hypothetical protein
VTTIEFQGASDGAGVGDQELHREQGPF